MADVNIKAKIDVETGNSTESIKKTQDAMKGASTQTKEVGSSFGKLKGELGTLSPALGQASQGVGALTQAFNILKANPIIGVFALIAGLVVALFQKFKQMEAVSDALGKAFGTLSGVFNKFISAILTPLIDGFVKLTELVTGGLISVLSTLGVTSEKTAQRFGEITEALDDLEDAQRNSAIATAEANRKLQDAREIAADATRPVKERVAALKEAARIEKEESQKVIEINQTKARLTMEAMAMEMGARAGLIAKIREGSIEQLKAARMELMNMKNVDKDKLTSIDNMIIAAENEAASMAKISKKTQSQITAIEKDEHDKRNEQDRRAAEKRKAIKDKELAEEKQRLSEIAEMNKAIHAREQEIEKIGKTDREKRIIDLQNELDTNLEKYKNNNQARLKAYELYQLGLKQLDKEENLAKDIKEKDQTKTHIDGIIQRAQGQIAINDQLLANIKANTKQVVATEEQKRDTYKMTGEAMNALGDIVGKQTIAGKALAVAQALINTYLGVTEVLRNKTIVPEPFGTIQKVASVATILASGFSAIKNITRTQVPGGGGGGSTPSMGGGIEAPVSPQATATTLSASTIQSIGNAAAGGVNRAYVLDADVRNSDERNARLQRAARLGG